jgi:uncharacterized membrane protein YraQ (UPF0718 family)
MGSERAVSVEVQGVVSVLLLVVLIAGPVHCYLPELSIHMYYLTGKAWAEEK